MSIVGEASRNAGHLSSHCVSHDFCHSLSKQRMKTEQGLSLSENVQVLGSFPRSIWRRTPHERTMTRKAQERKGGLPRSLQLVAGFFQK